MLLERERRADHKKRFWPGEPFERNAKRLADDAARAIGPDEPSAASQFHRSRAGPSRHLHPAWPIRQQHRSAHPLTCTAAI